MHKKRRVIVGETKELSLHVADLKFLGAKNQPKHSGYSRNSVYAACCAKPVVIRPLIVALPYWQRFDICCCAIHRNIGGAGAGSPSIRMAARLSFVIYLRIEDGCREDGGAAKEGLGREQAVGVADADGEALIGSKGCPIYRSPHHIREQLFYAPTQPLPSHLLLRMQSGPRRHFTTSSNQPSQSHSTLLAKPRTP